MTKLGDISFVTKLAGFEHTKYIQGHCTHHKIHESDIPLFIGKTVKDGLIDQNYDWYIPLELSEKLRRSQLRNKCIILPYVGTVGDLAIYDGTFKAHLGSNIAKIELNKTSGYTIEFIYYFLKSSYGQKLLLKDLQGAVQKNITMEAIRNVELPSISLSEQNSITDILECLNNKIINNNQIITQLESLAKTIYDYWFLQFEFPNEDGKPYKSSGGKMLWNEKLKREIPEGWDVKKIKDCVQHINTGLNPRDNFVLNEGGDIKYITVKNLTTEGTLDFIGCDTITPEVKQLINKRSMVAEGDILFASIAPLGRCFLIYETPEDWEINESVFSIRPNTQCVNSEYLYMFFMSDWFVKKAEHSSTGSVFNGIRISALEDTPLVVPPKYILKKFKTLIMPLFKEKFFNGKQNQELASLRDFLLPMLMNGQVTFKD